MTPYLQNNYDSGPAKYLRPWTQEIIMTRDMWNNYDLGTQNIYDS